MFAEITSADGYCGKSKECMIIERVNGSDKVKLSLSDMVGSNSIQLVEHIYRIQCQRGGRDSGEARDICQISINDDTGLLLNRGVSLLQNNGEDNIELRFEIRRQKVSASSRDALSCRHSSLCHQREYAISIKADTHQLMRAKPGLYYGRYLVRITKNTILKEKWWDLIVEIPAMVKVSGLSDIVLTEQNNLHTKGKYSARYLAEQAFCIYSSSGSYMISAMGSNHDGNNHMFFLGNGANKVRYRLSLATDNRRFRRIRHGQRLDGDNASLAPDCSGASNIKLRIAVLQSWLSGKPAGTYSDVVYLHVMPK